MTLSRLPLRYACGPLPARAAAPGSPGAPAGGMACYLTIGRERKSGRLLASWAAGVGEGVTLTYSGDPLPGVRHHCVWGQLWTAETVIPLARARGADVWHLDNGWIDSARGGVLGHYRVTLNAPGPTFFPAAPDGRAEALGVTLAPWRRDGRHVVLALPGPAYGRAWGLDMPSWIADAEQRVRAATSRPVLVRPKDSDRPLADDLADAWALVTYASNVAVDAVLAGVPAIVEPGAPTAPLGNVGLGSLAAPELADRRPWLRSLLCQQWTLDEMRSGAAWRVLSALHGVA